LNHDASENIIKYLIEHKANIKETINKCGTELLNNACVNKNENLVKYLINLGVDINNIGNVDKAYYILQITWINKI